MAENEAPKKVEGETLPAPAKKADPTQELVEDTPVSKMTRAEFIARFDQLIAEGEASELPTSQIVAQRYARQGTKRITSIVDTFLDGLAE